MNDRVTCSCGLVCADEATWLKHHIVQPTHAPVEIRRAA